jgi:hypothetical protein
MALTQKEEYAKMVCLFLAEGLRTRRIPMKRAGEIAEKVLQNINLLDTETDFLQLVKELAKDFEELVVLEGKLAKSIETGEKRHAESLVREFAIGLLSSDSKTALAILQDAATGHTNMAELESKYPKFKEFTSKHAR